MNLSNFRIKTERIGELIPAIPADSPELLHAYWKEQIECTLQCAEKEHLHVILLDAKLNAIGFHLVAMGTLTEVTAHPREIIRPLIIAAAYGFAITHNHPSGDPSPSRQDEIFTRRMVEAADLMQLRMLDHLVIGQPRPGRSPYYSFRENGIII
jgi:DNA repair protein RadC